MIDFAKFEHSSALESKNRGNSTLIKIDNITNDEIRKYNEDAVLLVADLSCFRYALIVLCNIVFKKFKKKRIH